MTSYSKNKSTVFREKKEIQRCPLHFSPARKDEDNEEASSVKVIKTLLPTSNVYIWR